VTVVAAELIGESPGMLAALETVARVAESTASVLIHGESGTGKLLLAQVIHQNSARRGRPLAAIDCAAIPDDLVEPELFGHEASTPEGTPEARLGAFERASGGTLFLGAIDRASPFAQARIVGALQGRQIERVGGDRPVPVDVRVIAATTRDLRSDMSAGEFREDLYYLLAVVSIALPPLCERGDDIRLLAERFAGHFARAYDRPALAIARETLTLLLAHPWPGNIPQLRSVIERAVLAADGPVLESRHLPAEMRSLPRYSRRQREQPSFLSLAELERRHIHYVLSVTGGRLDRAAAALGIHRRTLRRKLEEHGIKVEQSRVLDLAKETGRGEELRN
jgi:two-component system response regulator HydG